VAGQSGFEGSGVRRIVEDAADTAFSPVEWFEEVALTGRRPLVGLLGVEACAGEVAVEQGGSRSIPTTTRTRKSPTVIIPSFTRPMIP
jgi:hypothetical protein